MGRGVMIALAVSLGLNFFAGGFLLRDVLREDAPLAMVQPDAALEGAGALRRAVTALPPESRRQLRREMRGALPDMRARQRALQERRKELRALFQVDEWDDAAVSAKMSEIRTLRAEQSEAFDQALARALSALSAEDRRRMIERAEERREVRRRHRERPMRNE